jgi:hypothetical protein
MFMAHAFQSQYYTFLDTLASHHQVMTEKLKETKFSIELADYERNSIKTETITFMKR